MSENQKTIVYKGMKITVAAFGSGWIAVDKPCGLSIHNDPGNDLVSAIPVCLEKDNLLREKTDFDKKSGVNPVNRIDGDTSGIILLGLRKDVTSFFSRQFQERKVEKKYIALVHGHIDTGNEKFLWEKSLSPKAGGRKNPVGAGKKVSCATEYRSLDTSEHYSLIECDPLTGRKHQIRRHAKLNGTPIVCDKKYGSPRSIKFLKENCSFTRLGLHSKSLSITTPAGEKITIESIIPEEIIRLFESDKKP